MLEYGITADETAAALGIEADRLVEVSQTAAVALPDGAIAVLLSVELADRAFAGHVLWAINASGMKVAQHLPEDVAPVQQTQVSIAALAGGVVVHVLPLHRPEARPGAFLIPWRGDGWGAVRSLSLTRPLPEAVAAKGFTVQVEPCARGFGDGKVAAFATHTSRGDETTRTGAVAFLAVDIEQAIAEWRVWPDEGKDRPRQGGGLLSRLLGQGKPVPLPRLRNDSFPRLEGWGYPILKGDPTVIGADEAALVGDRVILHTPGAGGTLKYGWRCDALAEMGPDGQEVRRIRFEDFVNHPQAIRKHGRTATCVNGGRHWVISSAYKSTDPLKGKMALVDTATGQERVISPPKPVSAGNWHQRNPVEVTESHVVWMQQNEDGVSHSIWLTGLP